MKWSKPLFIDPRSDAHRQTAEWRRSRPNDAALIGKIAAVTVTEVASNSLFGTLAQEPALAGAGA